MDSSANSVKPEHNDTTQGKLKNQNGETYPIVIDQLRPKIRYTDRLAEILIIIFVMIGAALVGLGASFILLAIVGSGIVIIVMLRWPHSGLIILIMVALFISVEIGTGTEVTLNLTVMVIPALLVIWVINMLVRREIRPVSSISFIPLGLFIVAALMSLAIGNVLWDPIVPKSSNFLLVQLAQWAIFALSALVYLLSANLINNEKKLRVIVFGFIAIAGFLSIINYFAGPDRLIGFVATIALIRAPFWILLSSLVGGQLLFNRDLRWSWRLMSILTLLAVFLYTFIQERESVSNWVGVLTVAGLLVWLRWPKLRLPITILTAMLILTGILTQTLWNFGGGDSEWSTSGGSRIALITRVIDVTSANPVTGLGPAAYRKYAALSPLAYGKAYWIDPAINAHNNYVDIYSQTGLVGLGLFLWFMVTVLMIGWRLLRRYQTGFVAGYVNGMIAAWFAVMAIMMLLDWFLPFVYNVGFPGFQASLLAWVFFGGLVAVESWPGNRDDKSFQNRQ